MAEYRIDRINIGDTVIYCRVVGSGMPLILLHNGFYSQDTWDSVIDELSQNYTVYSYDRYGYGHSTHLCEMTEDIVSLGVTELEELVNHYNLNQINLLGHCLGGAVAALYTAAHPENVNKIVAESVGYYSDDGIQVKADWTFVPYEQTPEALRSKLISMHGGDYAETFWNAIRVYKGGYIMNHDYDITKTVKSIKRPYLFIMGDRDFYFDISHPLALYKKMKNAQFAIIPNAGHDVHDEKKYEFLAVVKNFLK